MISADIELGGFDARHWLNLLSLFQQAEPEPIDGAPGGTLVVVEESDGRACAAFHTGRGRVDLGSYAGRDNLGELCRLHGAKQAWSVRRGGMEALCELAAQRIPLHGDYVTQMLSLAGALRQLEDEGVFHRWPTRKQRPLPSTNVLSRALELVLPDGRALVICAFRDSKLWTGLALRRDHGQLDRVAGPDLIAEWAGPTAGDLRRDHRAIVHGVSRSLAPVHLGVFAQESDLRELMRNPEPGAWARAIALREILIDPAPPYVTVAAGADALRSAARRANALLGGVDLGRTLAPLAQFARSQAGELGSVTGLLGFNPLQALARRLNRREDAD